MAYKQTPGRGNRAKTGHGIPAPFKQMETIKKIGSAINAGGKWLADAAEGRHGSSGYSESDSDMREKNIARKNPKSGTVKKTETKKPVKSSPPAKQTMGATGLGAGTKEGKYATEGAKKAYKKFKDFDKSLEGNSDTRSYEMNDTVLGRRAVGAQAGKKVNPKSGSPVKQMETINKVVSKAKEIGSKIVGGIKKMDKALEGNSDTRSYERSDTVLGRRSTGARAGEKISNPKAGSPTKQLNKKAVTKMGGKKTPAKMKKC